MKCDIYIHTHNVNLKKMNFLGESGPQFGPPLNLHIHGVNTYNLRISDIELHPTRSPASLAMGFDPLLPYILKRTGCMGRKPLFYEDARAKHKKIQLFTVVFSLNLLTDLRQQIVF